MRALITLEYDGTNYYGWQKNGETNTVCLQVENAFERVLNKKVKIVASGRTDSGVHAYCQCAHFDLPENCNFSLKNVMNLVNKELPNDIVITSIKEVSSNFHARYNVKSKTYLYKCYLAQVNSPIRAGKFCYYPAVLNLEKMKQASNILLGKHNFKAFCLSGGDNETFERELISIDIVRKKDELFIYVKGKGFLYSMVRIIVGTLLAVGQNKLELEDVKLALEKGDKSKVGEKMPAHGLYLYNVEY